MLDADIKIPVNEREVEFCEFPGGNFAGIEFSISYREPIPTHPFDT